MCENLGVVCEDLCVVCEDLGVVCEDLGVVYEDLGVMCLKTLKVKYFIYSKPCHIRLLSDTEHKATYCRTTVHF